MKATDLRKFVKLNRTNSGIKYKCLSEVFKLVAEAATLGKSYIDYTVDLATLSSEYDTKKLLEELGYTVENK